MNEFSLYRSCLVRAEVECWRLSLRLLDRFKNKIDRQTVFVRHAWSVGRNIAMEIVRKTTKTAR